MTPDRSLIRSPSSTVYCVSELAERLGYGADDRVVIVTADWLGTCHAANVGVYDVVRANPANSGGLMVPGAWARHATANYRGEPIGVHLTLNSEYDTLRWGPITQAPSLLDGEGGFPRTVEDLWDHADLDEARRECRAQLERAILLGFDISHLSSHLSALLGRPEFFDVYLELAVEFQLPLRLGGADSERMAGFPMRQLAAEEGVIFPDHADLQRKIDLAALEATLADLPPGVTELVIDPAIDSPELHAIDDDAFRRSTLHSFASKASGLDRLISKSGAHRASYADLRSVQRGRIEAQ